MKAYLSKKNSLLKNTTDENRPLNISYSEREFFYEGQECRTEDDEISPDKEKTHTKDKQYNPFRGNFNIFF